MRSSIPPHKNRNTDAEANRAGPRQRLDKWLWAARFYKTRTLASDAIDAGKVRVAGERVKPAREVKAGDRVLIEREGLCWDVEVLGLASRRGPASEAALLYREGDDSRAARERTIAQKRADQAANPDLKGRPTKRMRRVLQKLLKESRGGR